MNKNLWQEKHSGISGGSGTTIGAECSVCGSMLRYLSDGSCVSCKKMTEAQRKYGANKEPLRKQLLIRDELERIKEQKQIEQGYTTYAI